MQKRITSSYSILPGLIEYGFDKKLTGKNPDEYEGVAKSLVDNSDVNLFAKLVKQDDFLFDFVKIM